MAYVNVAEWKTDQVCEWLKGLDNSVHPYVHSFTNNKVNGQQLLSVRSEDLEQLGVLKVGHQELLLEAVESLRNFHYELDRENLQLLALRLSCQAHSLHNELSRQTDSKPVTTQTLSDVVGVITAVKPLVRWLDKQPFCGKFEYNDKKTKLLQLSIEMATCAQRDRFAEKPIEEIRTTCRDLAHLGDYIIQEISDPMILQPTSLDLATLKKKPGDDLGFYILPSFHGIHQIAEIKFSSLAHQCGKMEEGDEVVQVNYETVVGWERKNVLELFNESPAEVLLTLKRRPRHTKVFGQIYIKPYRLPSNKKAPYVTRWQHNLPSPRPELLTIPDFTMPLSRHSPKDPNPKPADIVNNSILDTTDSSGSDSEVELPVSQCLYTPKPRTLVQRRATVTGASPTTKHALDIEQFWNELKQEHSITFQLKDKAVSCAQGLNTVPSNLRAKTCLGIEQPKAKPRLAEERKKDEQLTPTPNSNRNEMESVSEVSSLKNVETAFNINTTSLTSAKAHSAAVSIEPQDSSIKGLVAMNKPPEIIVHCYEDPGIVNKNSTAPDECKIKSIGVDVSNLQNLSLNHSNWLNSTELRSPDTKGHNGESEVAKVNSIQCVTDEKCYESNSILREKNLNISGNTDSNDNPSSFIDSEENDNMIRSAMINAIPPKHQKDQTDSDYQFSKNREVQIASIPNYIEIINNNNSEGEAPLLNFNKTTDNTDVLLITSLNNHNERSVGSLLEGNLTEQIMEPSPNTMKRESKPEERREKLEVSKKLGGKSAGGTRLTPPEPPPRKYSSLTPSLNLNNRVSSELSKKTEVPDKRSNYKGEGEKEKSCSNVDTRALANHWEAIEGYRNLVEKSMDFADELSPSVCDKISITHCDYLGSYANRMNENKLEADKYEPFTEKFGNKNKMAVPNQPEVTPRAAHTLNQTSCSPPKIEVKPRTLEKDKSGERGVVNRAMMMAKSIGLNSALKLSSPRSTRKHSMLAKKRNVSVKSIGSGEMEGWLTYRSRGARGAWMRSWFVLKESSLYRFKNPESDKSDCLIVLPGFTASHAAEVKSRNYAFKVYHTGTVFYFAADTEDNLVLWLDSINKVTLGADCNSSAGGLFSETDDSDSESKGKLKSMISQSKANIDKVFLKQHGRKDSGARDHDLGAASLDRKYLRFLSPRTQNVPVPTAQFRSYRRVLPPSAPNAKPESASNSPDFRVTVAGSTFYALTQCEDSMDRPAGNQDMGDYRHTIDRCHMTRNRRPDDLNSFLSLEEFMLSHQRPSNQQCNTGESTSPHTTSLTNDHVQLPYRENSRVHPRFSSNEMIYDYPRYGDQSPISSRPSRSSLNNLNVELKQDKEETIDTQSEPTIYSDNLATNIEEQCLSLKKLPQRSPHYSTKSNSLRWQNMSNSIAQVNSSRSPTTDVYTPHITSNTLRTLPTNDTIPLMDSSNTENRDYCREPIFQSIPRQVLRNTGYPSSTENCTDCTASRSLQRSYKDVLVNRNGSFNLHDRYREDKSWVNPPRRTEQIARTKKKPKLKDVTQYQPPPLPSPFDQDRIKPAFVMHLNREHTPKTGRLKTFFGSKSPHKMRSSDVSSEQSKTLLGSPRLHRALFKDRGSNQKQQSRSGSHSPQDSDMSPSLSAYSTINQHHLPHSNCNYETSIINSECSAQENHKKGNTRYMKKSPTLSDVTSQSSSPQDDYPGLEYPPVFEPGTYSLSDSSLLSDGINSR